MKRSDLHWAWLLVALLGLNVPQAHAYIADSRWSRTATNFFASTGPKGTPIILTWSFAPDRTRIPGNISNTAVDSNLIAFLDANWGAGPGGEDLTERPWFTIFDESFARLSTLCGVTYVYEPQDDGKNFSGTAKK